MSDRHAFSFALWMTEPEDLDLLYLNRPVMRPSARTWAKHILLLTLTFCTATVAGLMYPFGRYDWTEQFDPQTLVEASRFPLVYPALIVDAIRNAVVEPGGLAYGLTFSISLLFILVSHEMGHYLMCRRYHVDATLPFFIPTPPMIGPAGTFGAFIKILSPMPARKAVFDMGVAGPIAGFIALLPVAVAGLLTMEPAGASQSISAGLVFSDPLLMKLGGLLVGHNPSTSYGNAFYYAAWVGLLVTALNLIPSGQLDGGHAIYAVFGETIHRWTGRIAFPVMAILAISGLIFFGSPSGFLVAIILAVMMRIRHPQPWDMSPLDAKRKVIAFLTLIIFVLCFVPFPIQIN